MGFGDLMNYLSSLKFFGSITIGAISVYALALIISTYGKALENRYFHKKNGFPTTYLMLYMDEQFSADYKDKFRKKVKKLLQLDLLAYAEETNDRKEAIRRLNESFKHIILKVGAGKLVKQQNIWYGFRRNVCAGSLFAFILSSISALIVFYWMSASSISLVFIALMFLYAVLFFAKKTIIQIAGEEFAKQVISEFMVLNE
jgi:hypothetical protein